MISLRTVSAWLLLAVSAAGGVLVPSAHRAAHGWTHAAEGVHEHAGHEHAEGTAEIAPAAASCDVCEWLARASAAVPPEAPSVPEPPTYAADLAHARAAVWTAATLRTPPDRGPPTA